MVNDWGADNTREAWDNEEGNHTLYSIGIGNPQNFALAVMLPAYDVQQEWQLLGEYASLEDAMTAMVKHIAGVS